jgi:hypothetical protein
MYHHWISRVGFWVLMAMNVKMTFFWDVEMCSLIEIGTFQTCLFPPSSSVYFYQTSWQNIPEDNHLQTDSRLNLRNSASFVSFILPKNLNMKIYKTVILHVVLCGCEHD